MQSLKRTVFTLVVPLVAASCASSGGGTPAATTPTAPASTTTFVSSWKSPTAQPLQIQGAKVAAVVTMSDLAARRSAEDKLASEISARGAVGVPMYSLVEQAGVEGEPTARDALEKEGVRGIVVLHPGALEQERKAKVDYSQAPYNTYWSGYYAYGWASPWTDPGNPSNFQTVVSVETMVYSLAQNQLVWAGRSKTTNPSSLNDLVAEVAAATAGELSQVALLPANTN